MNDRMNAPGPSPFTEGHTFGMPSHGGPSGTKPQLSTAGTEQQSPRWPSLLPVSPCSRPHSYMGVISQALASGSALVLMG